jgi:hypothetical protein
MNLKLLPKLNYSNVIATIALFVALGGAAVAAGLPKNSVGPRQLKRGAVTAAKIRKQAVTSGKIAPGAVGPGKIGPNAIGPGNIGNGAITSAKIAAGAVIANSIKNNVVTTNKLNNGAVTGQKLAAGAVGSANLQANSVGTTNLANGSVTAAKLGKEIGPLLGNLKAGQTLQGSIAIGSDGAAEATTVNGGTFQFPLAATPVVNIVNVGAPGTAACPGLGTGQNPQATAGNLCIYLTNSTNVKSLTSVANGASRFGFALEATSTAAGKFSAYGQWAVTAS